MAVTRRGFLQSTAGAAGALAASVSSGRTVWTEELVPSESQRSTVHILGPAALRPLQKLVRRLSDDVFDRVCQVFEGRTCQLVDVARAGAVGPWGQTFSQMHTAVQVSNMFAQDNPPPFDLKNFRFATNAWIMGQALLIGWRTGGLASASEDNRRDTFAGITVMGIPYLPTGMEWAAHYVDEQTGVFMRVVATYDINVDEVVVRWDVICG